MSAPQAISVQIPIGFSAVGGVSAADDYYVCHGMNGEYKLEAAYFTPMVAVSAHASNFVSLTIHQGFEGTSTAITSALTTDSDGGGAEMAIGTVREFTMLTTDAAVAKQTFGATDVIFIDHDEAGSFTDAIEGIVTCRLVKVRE